MIDMPIISYPASPYAEELARQERARLEDRLSYSASRARVSHHRCGGGLTRLLPGVRP